MGGGGEVALSTFLKQADPEEHVSVIVLSVLTLKDKYAMFRRRRHGL